jgi:NADPH:quinone reductase
MTMQIPDTMTAIEITDGGGAPDVLKSTARPVPQPASGEVLIKVVAAGVNRPDVLQRQGAYPPPPGASDIPGLEVAGEIVAMAGDVTDLAIGDAVMALVTGGGYAEYCTAPAAQCLPIPGDLTMEQAAAVPETFFTVWNNVLDRSALLPGESFLVHGGSSGIGTTAIQLAKAFGARVFATAGSAEKCKVCEELGAERAINYRDEDFVQIIKDMTGTGVDVILDMVGGDYIQRNIKALAPEGRLCYIAFLNGSVAEINLMPLMLKRLTLTGSTLRAMPVSHKAAIAENLREKVWPLIEAGTVGPVMHATFALDQAAEAHALMETNAHIGKIVLKI